MSVRKIQKKVGNKTYIINIPAVGFGGWVEDMILNPIIAFFMTEDNMAFRISENGEYRIAE